MITYPEGRRRIGAQRIYAVLTAVWLIGLIVPAITSDESRYLFQFVALAWLGLAGILLGREHFVYWPALRRDTTVRIWAGLSLAAVSLSAICSTDRQLSLSYLFVTLVGLSICGGLWYCARGSVEFAISLYAILASAIVSLAYFTAFTPDTRLSLFGLDHPNHLALVSFGILAASLSLRNRFLAAALILLNLTVIVATQARGALLAATITITLYLVLVSLNRKNRRGFLALALSVPCFLAFALAYQSQIAEAVAALLFLHDSARGVGTGFTGRVVGWHEAYQLFVENPILGVGFRAHDQYMTYLTSAHNGYLSLLAETGILGAAAVGGLIVVCAFRLFKRALCGENSAMLGLSLLAGYLFIAIFERFLINVGNPTSLLVWMFLFMPPNKPTRQVEQQVDICRSTGQRLSVA